MVLIGGITSDFLKSTWNIGIPYRVVDLVYAALMLTVIYVGVQISVRVQLILVSISAVVIGAFFIYIVIKGGTGGNSLTPFKPSSSADGWKGIFFGFIYAILLFTGFETAANLGEETEKPAPGPFRGPSSCPSSSSVRSTCSPPTRRTSASA